MTSSSLPIFALPYPLILLPASHLTISVPKDVEVSFLNLIDQADTKTLPVVAVVPIVANTPTTLAEWGTAARLVRVVQRSAKSSHHASQPSLVVLHGLSRVRVLNGKNKSADLTHSGSLNLLPVLPIEYAPTEKVPSLEAVNKFRQSALRMLDQLGKDDSLSQRSKHEGYAKIAEMVEEMTAAKIPWLVDILVASINVDHSDKLGELHLQFYSLCFTTFVSCKLFCAHPTLMRVSTLPPKSSSKSPLSMKCPKKLQLLSMSLCQTSRKSSFSDNRWQLYNAN